MQADIDFRKGFTQIGHRQWQHIPGLRVGGGNRQCAAVLRRILLTDTPQISDFAHDDFYAFEGMLARLGDALQAFAMARKDFHAQFFFKLDDGLGNTRLGRVQRTGGFSEVQVASDGFLNKAKLMKVHSVMRLFIDFIMPFMH